MVPCHGATSLGAALALLLVACSADEPALEERGQEDVGQEGEEQVIASLAEDERRALCDDTNDQLSQRFGAARLLGFECTRLYLGVGDAQTCEQSVDDCVQSELIRAREPFAERYPEYVVDDAECASLASCDVEREQWSACVRALFDDTDRVMRRVSCSIASDPEAVEAALAAIGARRPTPAACAGVVPACAAFFD